MTTTALLDRPDTGVTLEAGETVHVLTWRLLDYAGEELTLGGLQRWLLALLKGYLGRAGAGSCTMRTNGTSRAAVLGPSPSTRARSPTRRNGPCRTRCSTIACALVRPIPGSVHSWAIDARLSSTVTGRTHGKFGGAATPTATSRSR